MKNFSKSTGSPKNFWMSNTSMPVCTYFNDADFRCGFQSLLVDLWRRFRCLLFPLDNSTEMVIALLKVKYCNTARWLEDVENTLTIGLLHIYLIKCPIILKETVQFWALIEDLEFISRQTSFHVLQIHDRIYSTLYEDKMFLQVFQIASLLLNTDKTISVQVFHNVITFKLS